MSVICSPVLLLMRSMCLEVFLDPDGAMYAFKGLAGRLGPIGVHASMLGILAGVAWGGVAGYKGSIMAPQGGEFITASALRPASSFAQPPQGPPPVLMHPTLPLVLLASAWPVGKPAYDQLVANGLARA